MSESILNKKVYPIDRLTQKDIDFFLSQIALMLKYGVPLQDALAKLENASKNSKLKKFVKSIEKSVSNGDSFVDALLIHRKTFSPVFVQFLTICKNQNLDFNKLLFDYQNEERIVKGIFNAGNRGAMAKLSYFVVLLGILFFIILGYCVLPII